MSREIRERLPGEGLTLAERLAGAGYATAAVVSHTLLSARYGFDQGYEIYTEDSARGFDHVSSDEVTEAATGLLAGFANDPRPFHLLVHYFDPHYSYQDHAGVDFARARVGRIRPGQSIRRLRRLDPAPGPRETQQLRALYDEEVRHVDAAIGRLLEALDRHGLGEETIVALTADHGEALHERGWIGHTVHLYDEILAVPLIVYAADPRIGPRRVEEPVSTVSLAPDAAGAARARRPAALPRAFAGSVPAGPTPPRPRPAGGRGRLRARPARERREAHGQAGAGRRVVQADPRRRERLARAVPPARTTRPRSTIGPTREPERVQRMLRMLEQSIARAEAAALAPTERRLQPHEVEELRALGYVDP